MFCSLGWLEPVTTFLLSLLHAEVFPAKGVLPTFMGMHMTVTLLFFHCFSLQFMVLSFFFLIENNCR